MDLSTCLISRPSVHTGLSGLRLTPACHSGLTVVTDQSLAQSNDVSKSSYTSQFVTQLS